jgi:hypothetical protein
MAKDDNREKRPLEQGFQSHQPVATTPPDEDGGWNPLGFGDNQVGLWLTSAIVGNAS